MTRNAILSLINLNRIQFWSYSSNRITSNLCHREWWLGIGKSKDRAIEIMIYQVIPDEPHYSLPSSFPRPIGTLSHRRHRYNNVACQSIRPISRELKLQRGSFRVNFPAIKTGNVRNCGEIAAALSLHRSSIELFARISTRGPSRLSSIALLPRQR